MSSLVLDCSIAVAWCFADEAAPATDEILDRVRDHGAIVPSLWRLEVANVLLMASRRQRIPAGTALAMLDQLAALPLDEDRETSARAWTRTITLAQSESLTVYDAAYLELASRLGLPLATKDKELAAAGHRAGLTVLPTLA
ncbi:Predicted nucleic acid-binding protein, contains PIN domain [Arboricoccus pini]|uniref:Predicted nucleic acid-binding protein, contains PIN domain n=1 Tax=Arboricoccus pini TaxID=1963835 RepID=A0A212RQX4_9PROT|nr:type II toxin-antitoxin system VapC family toxin [Arboricoccus pini]SNB74997.1 Predicted nucleic acid-binding protein, contains PIN domain [Arboricoccus pini]